MVRLVVKPYRNRVMMIECQIMRLGMPLHEYAGKIKPYSYDYVVVAVGFDPLWFKLLLDNNITINAWGKEMIETKIGYDLSVNGIFPRIHLPLLADFAQGPGFPNLSCLGLISDRILAPYII